MQWEVVIGLETHAQLTTQSKIFSGAPIRFGAEPNTQACPVDLALPGVLPVMNKGAVERAIQFGLAIGATIAPQSVFARKNYFYPDLPKGYQITQHTTPICVGGAITIKGEAGDKIVQLNRIHLEEDAGKSIHDISELDTYIDLNRAGTPLVEIVTEPCIHSAQDAFLFVSEMRRLVRWMGVCDGNMEEGSLRCDANISIRLKGDKKLGTRVEVKNLNSIRNIKKAIEFEIDRLIQITETGGTILQQTRSFDANNDTTFSIRDKEDANDYRYFPDPDLAPFQLTEQYIKDIENAMPVLPGVLKNTWKDTYALSDYDVEQLCENKEEADFYAAWTKQTSHYKSAANWILGPIREYLNENNTSYNTLLPYIPYLVELLDLVASNQLNFSVASGKVFKAIMQQMQSPTQYAKSNNLLQSNSSDEIEVWVDQVLLMHPEKIIEYKKGKKGLIGLFTGEVKKLSQGKADPKVTMQLLEQKLK